MPEALCSSCRKFDFRKYIYESRFFAFTLGSWRRISNREDCPFCRLVRDAILSNGYRPSSKSLVKLSNKKSWKACTSFNEYHGVRGKDYSNEFDLYAHAEKTHASSRYQLYLWWGEHGVGPHVYLRPLRSEPFFGRVVSRDRADLSMCRKWVDSCDEHHSGPMEREHCIGTITSRFFLRERLRLIDVEKMIIVRGSSDRTEYVALTYVWGEEKLKRERPPGWQMPRTLRVDVWTDEYGVEIIELPGELPHTIRDAMEVTRCIGYRYLWVDSLCIIQDDQQDQDLQISMMDEIYRNATLTIAAGSGLHADWGLPGVSRRRRYAQRSQIVDGIELAVAFPSFRELNSGTSLVWNTRGWTLQEKLLSKRLLLFTDFQVYFRCANSVCAEDIAMETGVLSKTIKRRQNPFAWAAVHVEEPALLDQVGDYLTFEKWKLTDKNWKLDFLPNYVAVISEFTQRTFSFSQDRLKAIHGVLRTLDPSERAFPGGLPRAWLAETLLWQPRNGSEYFIDIKTVGMPTWSWAAWSLSEGCVWSEYARPDAIAGGEPQTTIHVREGEDSVNSYCVWTSYKTLFGSKKTTPHSLSKNARQLLKSTGTLLSFRTSACFIRIGLPTFKQNISKDALQSYYLMDNDHHRVGKVWTCAHVARSPRKHQFIALSSRRTGIAISSAVDDVYIPKSAGGDDTGPSKKPASSWKVINVMLVDWKGDVAFRVAVGQIISTAWNEETMRLIYLG